MNWPRKLFGAVSCNDGRLRVFSGFSSLGLPSSVEAYDETTSAWTMGSLGRIKRSGHAVALAHNRDVYVIGGSPDGKTALSSVEVYSPATNSWSTAPNMPTARIGLGAATAKDGRIYAIGGGLPGKPSDVVEVYSPSEKSWQIGPSLPTPRLSLVRGDRERRTDFRDRRSRRRRCSMLAEEGEALGSEKGCGVDQVARPTFINPT